ncbi:effector-associated constant component EACC1 [Nocardia arthritidis]|uniref:Uncharacterized protein n=1 Tax=Nocardia arthritidis TaxID=228602 RepID=A0A6G9YKF7_9NOCA|nr:hypothetical protein [Nocardia arthritidis]QIS13671.1 hypothetical protein F5544_29130 [Nocardia arthritidis]
MELLVAVHGADDDIAELHSLFEALIEDDELRAAGKRLEPGAAHPQTLGAEEIIRIVLDSPALWTALSTCVAAWLQLRRPRLRLKFTRPDGSTAEIEADDGQVVEEVQVQKAIDIARGTQDEAS